MNVSFFQELLTTISERGRHLLPRSLTRAGPSEHINELAGALQSVRGEASGVAIASEILARYGELEPEQRLDFLHFLARTLEPDTADVQEAARGYLETPGPDALSALQSAVEGPRQEFFRRLNLAPGATARIVAMRKDMLAAHDPDLAVVDRDLRHLLSSWFNRGFLVLRRIDWQTPAAILDKIIAYEAVHEIQGWDDLRRRLDPADRRCFAFFHPSLVDEPLIFVEVALTSDIPDNIGSVLREAPKNGDDEEKPTTATFYSISNCQEGLRGISFGNFLIKQVVEDLVKERPSLRTFVTLSPIPGFADWLAETRANDTELLSDDDRERLRLLDDPDWWVDDDDGEQLKPLMLRLAAHYLANAKAGDAKPTDPVARFHLGNGARLERINWRADLSAKGLREAHGLMCNYRYEIKDIERNHEAFADEGTVASSRQIAALLKPERSRSKAGEFLALPTLRTPRLSRLPREQSE